MSQSPKEKKRRDCFMTARLTLSGMQQRKLAHSWEVGSYIRRGHIKILDRLRFSPPPRDPGPTAPQAKKKCNFSAAKCIF